MTKFNRGVVDTGTGVRYRSRFEQRVAMEIERATGKPVAFEVTKVKYTVPSRVATYTPDFTLGNGIHIEAKGLFDAADRQKHLLVKAQCPDMDVRIVFMKDQRLTKSPKSDLYSTWCLKHGIKCAIGSIPETWYKETRNATGNSDVP